MKIVSFICERKVIGKILEHLGLFQEQKRGPPQPPKKCPERVVEPCDDSWPEYEKPIIDVQTI